jgi:hypothetical protein
MNTFFYVNSISIAIILLSIFYTLFIYRRSNDILHYANIITILYISMFPLKTILTSFDLYNPSLSPIDEVYYVHAMLSSFLLYTLTIFPAFLFVEKARGAHKWPRNKAVDFSLNGRVNLKSSPLFILLLYIIVLSSMYNISLFPTFNEALEARLMAIDQRQGTAVSNLLGISLYILGFIATLELVQQRRYIVLALFFIYVLYFSIFTGSKFIPASIFLMSVYAYHYFIRNISFKEISLVGVIMALIILSIGALRGLDLSLISNEFIFFNFSIAFDGVDNFARILERLEAPFLGEIGFAETIMNYVYTVIPRTLWSDKPSTYGVWLVQEIFYPEANPMGVYGAINAPSAYGAAIAYLGLIYATIDSVLFGALLFYLRRNALSSNSLGAWFCYISLVVNINSWLRYGSETLIRWGLIVVLGIMIIYIFRLIGLSRRI